MVEGDKQLRGLSLRRKKLGGEPDEKTSVI